jgi:hypothetical protein
MEVRRHHRKQGVDIEERRKLILDLFPVFLEVPLFLCLCEEKPGGRHPVFHPL